MDEKIYTLVSTGLLAMIVLLLIAVVARLAKLERALSPREDTAAESPPSEVAPAAEETPATEEETPAESVATEAPEPDGEGPFEKDGRWWFRREDELLVYDEQSEAWVNADSLVAQPAETEPEVHPLDEARGWDATPQGVTAPEEATAAPIPEPVEAPAPIAIEAQPTAAPAATEEPAIPADTTEVTTPAPATEAAAPATEAPTEPGTHWKCPSCGVINGSTATSCRMCFTARP